MERAVAGIPTVALDRLRLAKYCDEVFWAVVVSWARAEHEVYNAVIDALARANALDMAYLKFQQVTADNCNSDRFTYNTLVYGVCKAGLGDKALHLVK
ncbi:hypothetical protein MLD38_023592 [Melastoma candidum]|uniref:Uncharacterized protein n=1 Tax=Melastoma candidum TaxID=119954 RepID=A0ACB9NPW1_9MYRT|nr:hypothetical protein MLD38_023592 [Melastoma candidum]